MDNSDQARAAEIASAIVKQAKYNKLLTYVPRPKQKEFHNNGNLYRYRNFMAGNQLGKTWGAAYEMAIHLTGRYPAWWVGKRFKKPVRAWAVGVTNATNRETFQAYLLGVGEEGGEFGTGSIPKDCIIDAPSARGIPGAVDYITVRHISGGVSRVGLKSCQAGREAFQGSALDFVWMDEQPPADIFGECMARLTETKGSLCLTFTPLKGKDEVVSRFIDPPTDEKERALWEKNFKTTIMTIEDHPNYGPEMLADALARTKKHERPCRLYAVPMRGEGAIFDLDQDIFVCQPVELPFYMKRIAAIDFGFAHPTAVLWGVWDTDADVLYITSEYRVEEALTSTNAAAILARGPGIPCTWPHDGNKRDANNAGDTTAAIYRKHGVNMLPAHAQHEGGGNSVAASIEQILDMATSGRLKVFSTCTMLLQEMREYHRKDGLVVDKDDDLIAALRYLLMSYRRHARVVDKFGARKKAKVPPSTFRDHLGLYGKPE